MTASINITIRLKHTVDSSIVGANEHDTIFTLLDNLSNRSKLYSRPFFALIVSSEKYDDES